MNPGIIDNSKLMDNPALIDDSGLVDYLVIDADNHYYEQDDAFTRHIERKYQDHALHVIEVNGGEQWVIDGNPVSYCRENPGALCPAPGSRSKFFSGAESYGANIELCTPKEMPALMQKSARLDLMDEQGIQAILQLPTVGVLFEPDIEDVSVLYANFRALNRWIEEEWGFGHDGRIFGVPLLSLRDVDLAVMELDRVADAGARAVCLNCGPVGDQSPADPAFGAFWSRVEERGTLVVYHVGNSGYSQWYASRFSETPNLHIRNFTAFQHYSCNIERPIADTIAALILHNLFGRFPAIQVATVELGSAWVVPLLVQLDKSVKMAQRSRWLGGTLDRPPSELFKSHVSVAPYHEENIFGLVEAIGANRVLFGSDFPHGEGLAEPLQFLESLRGMTLSDVRQIMRDNAGQLLHI